MRKIYVSLFSILLFSAQTILAQVTVSGSTGANGSYTSLTQAGGAFAAINAAGSQAGNTILITITASVATEDGTNTLMNGGWTTLTINPSGGVARVISGSVNGPLISLNGANNVTIDGLTASGNTLTISNTSTGASACTLRFINDASNNTITNTNFLGSSTGRGTIDFSTGVTTGNDNNSINRCNLSSSGSGTALNAIYSLGTSAAIDNSSNIVTVNNIADFFSASSSSAGINLNSFNSGWTISSNSFYQTATRTSTASNFHYGIFISNTGSGYTIISNIIGGSTPGGGGTAWTLAGAFTNRFVGIAVNANSAATTNIHGNTITNISTNSNSSASTASGNFSAIWVSGGSANIGTAAGNTIGATTGNGSITVNLQTNSGGIANLIAYSGTGTVDIRNNTIGAITLTASTAISEGCNAIFISGGTPTVIGNTIGSTVTSNSIYSSTVSTSGTAQQMNGIVITTGVSTNSNLTISNNTIANLTQLGTGATHYIRGISFQGQGSTSTITVSITNNTIYNLKGANANTTLASVGLGVMGIQYLSNTASANYSTPVITGNTIYSLSATNAGALQTNVCGIGASNCVLGTIATNKIYDLRNASTGTTATAPPTATGILIRAVVSGSLSTYNNMISLGNAQTTNTEFLGIWCGFSSSNANIYFNTAHIEGTAAAGALPSFCYLKGDNSAASAITATTIVQNNIFDNTRTGGTGNHYAIGNNYGNSTSPSTGWSSNNNALNSAVSTTIGYWSAAVNFANWKTASSSDALSISGYPATFTNTATGDLHINMGVTPTPMESGASTGTGITVDYDLQSRPGPAGSVNGGATAPDMGADEFDGVPLDLFAPTITYSLLINTTCTANRAFTASASDNSGVNITVGTRPRVYYKRSTDLNTWIDNTNGTNGWKYAEASNGASPFNFTIDYSLLFGGTGVTAGTTVQYFVVAQDLAATPNVAINSGTFTATPATVALTAAAFPIGGTINSYTITLGLNTVLTVGALGDYTSLTGASGLFNAINTNGLTGNTTVSIIDASVTETGAVALNQIQPGDCSLSSYSLLIKPLVAVTPTLTGSLSNNALIRVLSSNVTIDGSNNGTTSRNLTITNTNVTSPSVILFGSTGTVPVSNSTIKNSIIIDGANTASAVIVSDGSTAANPGYFSNITIQNNSIQLAYIGIFSTAVPTAGNGNGLLILGNDMNTSGANALRLMGVYVQGVDGATVTGNNIGNFEAVNAENDMGIWLATSTVNTYVTNNTISTLGYTGASANDPIGINITANTAAANDVIYGNTISGLSSSGTGSVSGITLSFATSGVTIYGNKISNIKNTNTGGYGANGIALNGTLTSNTASVYDNFIFDIAGYGYLLSATASDNGYGIVVTAGGGYNIYYNSVNMNTNQTVNGLPAAFNVTSGVTTAGAIDLRDNIFSNSQTVGTDRYAIYSGAANTVFSNIDYNDYYTSGPDLGYIGGNRANLAAVQAGFGANTNSLNVQPNFTSATDLHLVSGTNCGLDGYGTPVAGFTTDIDAQTRDITTPDMGGDEFTSSYSGTLAGIAGSATCENKAVSLSGTTFATSSCSLIATVLPSGGAQVSGKINACVTLDATQQFYNAEPYVQRHFDIEPASANTTTTSATITLYFTDAEFVNFNTNNPSWPPLPTAVLGNADPNRANLRITQFHGTPTTTPSTPGNYTANSGAGVVIDPVDANIVWNGSYWAVTFDVTGFSGFYVHSFIYALPITLNYLNGIKQGGNHLLSWKVTCNSTPSATLTLERSADGRVFSAIYNITATALRCNQPFDYTDAQPLNGMNYYRLKMVDADGKVSYSGIVALLNAVKGFDLVNIVPNPVTSTGIFTLNISSALQSKMELQVTDMQGRVVARQTVSLIAGYNRIGMNVVNLPAGTYTISGMTADDKTRVLRFVKQ